MSATGLPYTPVRQRFARIQAHYAKHASAIEGRRSEWAIDPYAWDHDAGIVLTPIESALWQDIRAEGLVMYPQYPVGRFFVDFANPAARVAIECDGALWHTDAGRDKLRQDEIERMGWSVYRITGRDCLTDTETIDDEDGRSSVRISVARRFIRGIAARHAVSRMARSDGAHGAHVFLPALIDSLLMKED